MRKLKLGLTIASVGLALAGALLSDKKDEISCREAARETTEEWLEKKFGKVDDPNVPVSNEAEESN